MSKIKYAGTMLLPNIFIVVYFIFYYKAQEYASVHFTIGYEIIIQIVGNIVFGLLLLFICIQSLCNHVSTSLSAYIMGVLILPLIYLISLIPVLNLPFVQFYVFDCMPYYFIFASIYIGLFIFLYLKRKKNIKKV